MSAPPTFGEGDEAWSLGSTVRVHWWARDLADWSPSPGFVIFDAVPIVERYAEGTVSAITAGGPEGWRVEVYLGPLLDLARPPGWPVTFNPSQVRRA